MSAEHAKAFIQDLLENPGIKEELGTCSTVEERLSVAKSRGYDVTIDDVREVAAALNFDFQSRATFDSVCRVVTAESGVSNCYTYNPAPYHDSANQ